MKQFKMLLLVGTVVLFTACGGGGSGGGTSNVVETSPKETPQEVVMKAFEAQVNGDIDSFLSRCALKGASDEQVAYNQKTLKVVKDKISLSGYSFEPLATGIFRDDTVAIVRAITSYTVNNEFEERDGILCYLKKEDNQWKLVRIFPDPLLNQEIFESSLELETNENSMLSLKNQKTFKSASGLHSLKELNEKLNRLLENSYIDNAQAIWDATFSTIGTAGKLTPGVPGMVLSGIAATETMAGLSKDFAELVHMYRYDKSSRLKSLKWTQISVGIAQLAIDAAPNKNAIPIAIEIDGLAGELNQVEHNLEFKQYIRELQAALMDPSLAIEDPYLVAYEQKAYGDGINISTTDKMIGQDGTKTYLYPFVTKIHIIDPMAIGKELPFKVAGEILFILLDEHVKKVLLDLGGEEYPNGNVRLALDITSMAQSVVETLVPDHIIDFNTNGLKSGNIGTVTCSNSPHKEPFSILLSNGSNTKEVQIETFMKELKTLSIFEEARTEYGIPYGIPLYKGGNRDIDIYGVFGDLPEIKKLPAECLDITMGDDVIASVSVDDYDDIINLEALEDGNASMKVGLKKVENFPPVSFPVEVVENCPMFYDSIFDIGEDHVITYGIEDKDKNGLFDDFLNCEYYESGGGHLKRSVPAKDREIEGITIAYYESGEKYSEVPVTKGKANGLLKGYYKSGKPYFEVPYVNDVKEGKYKEYYESGQLHHEVPYVNDVREGKYKEYYESGQPYFEVPYVNDVREGKYKEYYESGQLYFTVDYVNGVLEGEYKDYYKSGHLYHEVPYVNGVEEGEEREYYDSDGLIIHRIIPFVNGIQEGTVYGYYESGQLNFEIPYVNGQKNGTETYYHTNGDYNLNPWVNGQKNGNAPYYAKDKDGYYLAGCSIYVNDVITGSCMPKE